MLPANPLQHLLLQELNGPLVMTSGNLSGKPPAMTNQQALNDLDNIADEDIVGVNVPNGIPLVYELDADLKPIRHYYLGDAEAAAKAAAAVAAQGKA